VLIVHLAELAGELLSQLVQLFGMSLSQLFNLPPETALLLSHLVIEVLLEQLLLVKVLVLELLHLPLVPLVLGVDVEVCLGLLQVQLFDLEIRNLLL